MEPQTISVHWFTFLTTLSFGRDPLLQLRWNSWGFSTVSLGFLGNDSPLPITKKSMWPLGNVSRALKQCLANIWRLQRLHLHSKVEISRVLKSYMAFCGEFCLLMKIFLNPAKLKEGEVWLGCSVTLERMKCLVIFFWSSLNSFVVAVAKPVWSGLKGFLVSNVTPLVTLSIEQEPCK